MYWQRAHPRTKLLDPQFVHVPFGQDNSFYDGGSEYGLNDRHAAIPRHLAGLYLGRWEAYTSGRSWVYLERAAFSGEQINAEQFLLMHLRAEGVPVARFPPVAYLAMCIESPQCLHLFKGTTLGKRKFTYTAKYFSELVEVVRTVYDDEKRVRRNDWIWVKVPLYALDPEVSHPWQLHTLEFACGVGPSGPVSSRRWDLLRRCQCIK